MKKIAFISLFLFLSINIFAQYAKFSVEKTDNQNFKLVQIDFRKPSIFVSMQYTNADSAMYICTNKNIHIQESESSRQYSLKNSYNMPTCNRQCVLEYPNQKINFTFEFHKTFDTITTFDIVDPSGQFGFYGVKIDTTVKNDFIDIKNFIDETPTKEYGTYLVDDVEYQYYRDGGLMVGTHIVRDNELGKHYRADIFIRNSTGKDIVFNPSLIKFKIQRDGEVKEKKALSQNEYTKKVGRGNFWLQLLGLAVIATTDIVVFKEPVLSETLAEIKEENYEQDQIDKEIRDTEISNRIKEGYLKTNVIEDGTEYGGYVYTKSHKAEQVMISIPIEGKDFLFFIK